MRTTKSRAMLAAGSTAMLIALAGCGGSTSDNPGNQGPAGTVAVDVGNDMTVNLKTGPGLKVAVFIPGVANEFGIEQERAAKETATELGMDMTLFDAGYDPNKQLNQMQTAMTSGNFDAAVVMALDGVMSCKLLTNDFAKANILTSISGSPLCDDGANKAGKTVDEVWAPGTLNFVGSNTTRDYVDGWLAATAKANPGKQKVVAVLGPAVNTQTRVTEAAMAKLAADNTGYSIDTIYTDWTTTDAYNKTQTYLQGHPDTTLILSASSPDLTQGVIQAEKDAGLSEKIHVADVGFGKFQIQQLEAGSVQLSTMLFPYNQMKANLNSIAAAQRGDSGTRFVDDSVIGTAKNPFVVTKDTITELPSELR
ncbi:sugar ABC transporter substrate-binding protein [Paenarthrobacter nitroguajacolicus]|uniref:sugar ABC transporter substrate-binding protein n=1 Tax=Paenarthrobacter nitroguajacolicus TaxID=211146 RepID=UPI00342045FE